MYKLLGLFAFFQNKEPDGLCRSHRGDFCLRCGDFWAVIHLLAKEFHDANTELMERSETTQISFKHLTRIERYVAPCAYLPVHEDIDNWVVDGGALGKVCRHSSGKRMEGISWISRSKTGKNCVRSPADTVGHDHDNNHPGHFSLSFLGRLWFLLLQGNLSSKKQKQTNTVRRYQAMICLKRPNV